MKEEAALYYLAIVALVLLKMAKWRQDFLSDDSNTKDMTSELW